MRSLGTDRVPAQKTRSSSAEKPLSTTAIKKKERANPLVSMESTCCRKKKKKPNGFLFDAAQASCATGRHRSFGLWQAGSVLFLVCRRITRDGEPPARAGPDPCAEFVGGIVGAMRCGRAQALRVVRRYLPRGLSFLASAKEMIRNERKKRTERNRETRQRKTTRKKYRKLPRKENQNKKKGKRKEIETKKRKKKRKKKEKKKFERRRRARTHCRPGTRQKMLSFARWRPGLLACLTTREKSW